MSKPKELGEWLAAELTAFEGRAATKVVSLGGLGRADMCELLRFVYESASKAWEKQGVIESAREAANRS